MRLYAVCGRSTANPLRSALLSVQLSGSSFLVLCCCGGQEGCQDRPARQQRSRSFQILILTHQKEWPDCITDRQTVLLYFPSILGSSSESNIRAILILEEIKGAIYGKTHKIQKGWAYAGSI